MIYRFADSDNSPFAVDSFPNLTLIWIKYTNNKKFEYLNQCQRDRNTNIIKTKHLSDKNGNAD